MVKVKISYENESDAALVLQALSDVVKLGKVKKAKGSRYNNIYIDIPTVKAPE